MKNNTFGFGLMETLISLALMGGVSFLVMYQAGTFNQTKIKDSFDQEVVELATFVRKSLRDPVVCANFVSGVPIGTASKQKTYGGEIGEDHSIVLRPESTGSETKLEFKKNMEFTRRGTISDVRLLNDGNRDFIRVTFEKSAYWRVASLGALSVTKDIIIKGNKSSTASGEFMEDCRADELLLSDEEQCKKLEGSDWDPLRSEKCIIPDQLRKSSPTLVTRPIYLNSEGQLVAERVVVDRTMRCDCSKLRCVKSPNCECDSPLVCPSPLITESPPRRITHNSGSWGSENCDQEVECYRKVPMGPDAIEIGRIVVTP